MAASMNQKLGAQNPPGGEYAQAPVWSVVSTFGKVLPKGLRKLFSVTESFADQLFW
jgi:hypothetical protein